MRKFTVNSAIGLRSYRQCSTLCRPWYVSRAPLDTVTQVRCRLSNDVCRSFHNTIFLSKKSGKPSKAQNPASKTSSDVDPLDFKELEDGIAKAHFELKEALSKLRAGGRFNPELVENLRVSLEKGSRDTERLGDLAQIIPRGRILNVLVGEQEYVKPISSAIQSSNLSLAPQIDPHNALQLNINLPPPTTESRNQVLQAADLAAENATAKIKNRRQAHQKRIRTMQLSKAARPDELRKAGEKMEKIVEKAAAEVKATTDAAKKVLESG